MKKIVSLFLTVLLLFSLFSMVFAVGTGIEALSINPYGGAEDEIDTLSWYAASGMYFLFLPADTELSEAKVYFTASGEVKLDGSPLVSGGPATAFTVGEHTLKSGNATYKLRVIESAEIPSVFIETASGSLDYIHANKNNKEAADIRIYENGEMTLDSALKQMKGRGNATWTSVKKPYNIKFDKKTNLFGLGKAKKWTLLASYSDPSLIRNAFGWYFAEQFGLEYTSGYQHVDLYVNGNYLGNYIICESVEIGDQRVNINDLEDDNETANGDLDLETLPQKGTGANGAVQPGSVKNSAKWIDIPQSPENVTGGYLLEYEFPSRYNEELSGFVTENGQCVVLKSPELASEAEVKYIQSFVNSATNALYSETGYNAAGKHYSEYYDMDTLVAMYLVQELGANLDAGQSSLYLYKEKDSDKLVFSPIWDMDHAFGEKLTRYMENIGDPSIWWTNAMWYRPTIVGGVNQIPTVFAAAYRHADFRAAVQEKWTEMIGAGIIENAINEIRTLSAKLTSSAVMNAIRWNHFGTLDPNAVGAAYAAAVKVGTDYVSARKGYLTKGFSSNAAMLYYDANGGKGSVWNAKILSVGEAAVLIGTNRAEAVMSPPAGKVFHSWNTMPDGSGKTYRPGETLPLTTTQTVLYAIWKTQAEIDAENGIFPTNPSSGSLQSVFQRILDFFRRVFDFFWRLFQSN